MRVVQNDAAPGHHGLALVRFRHFPSESPEDGADVREDGFVQMEGQSQKTGDDFPGDIIAGGAQSAGDEQHIRAGEGFLEDDPDWIAIRDARLALDAQPQSQEFLPQIGAGGC